MSKGYGANAELIASDASGFLYAYSCYNVNLKNYEEARETADGEIWISRTALIEPEIHEKLKRFPSGRRKMVIKRIPRPVLYDELIASGAIKIRNASNTWETTESIDDMALRILRRVFDDYQRQGVMSKYVYIFF